MTQWEKSEAAIAEINKLKELADSAHITFAERDARIAEIKATWKN